MGARLQRRFDAAEVYLVIAKRFADFAKAPGVPPDIWFRKMTA